MNRCQGKSPALEKLNLQTERLGPLPIINHFIDRLGLEQLLERFVPTNDKRVRLSYAKALGVLLRSILVEREPIYRQQETVNTFAPEVFGLNCELMKHVGDDAIGRSLDRLFDADRASLLTELVVSVADIFEVSFEEINYRAQRTRYDEDPSKGSMNLVKAPLGPVVDGVVPL